MGKPELALYAKEDGTGRAYRHPLRTGADGKPLTAPTVTTVLKLVDKPALIQWAADKTVEWAVDNVSLLFAKDPVSAARWGRYRWQDVRNERAEVGTGIHETIEAEHTGTWNFPVLDDEQRRIMDQWATLNERYRITPHRSEFTVFGELDNDELVWAGTADGLWDIADTETGEFWENVVVDIKTSRNTWPEHWVQLAALSHGAVIMEKNPDGTWSEVEPPQYDGTALIHLREDHFSVQVETNQELNDLRYQQFLAYRRVLHFKTATADLEKGLEKERNVPW